MYSWCDVNGVMGYSMPMTLKECFEDAIDNGFEKGDEILIGEAKERKLEFDVFVDGIIESMEEDAGREIQIEPEEIRKLKYRLDKVVEDWIAEFQIGSEVYEIINKKRCVILETDFIREGKKYEWHDLSKNKNDLPYVGEEVLCKWIGSSCFWHDVLMLERPEGKDPVFSKGSGRYRSIINNEKIDCEGQVIAWKYIEL